MNGSEVIGAREREALRAVRDGLSVTAVLHMNAIAAGEIQARLARLGLIESTDDGPGLTRAGYQALRPG